MKHLPLLLTNEADGATESLVCALASLSQIPLANRSVRRLVRHVVILASRGVPEAEAATIALRTDDGVARAAEPASAQQVADLEHALREGPATDASARRSQRSGNLAEDRRWPEFGPRAAAFGFGSVVSVPLTAGRQERGVLTMLSRRRDAFSDDAARRCLVFADAAAAIAEVTLDRETSARASIAEYLIGEVLSRQPAEIRDLLLATSVLERFCGGLVDALTGRTDGERALEKLEHTNAFVVALDDRRRWYRHHRLFGELLSAELRREAPGRLLELHRRAATWHAANGPTVDALRHALAAQDWHRATGLLVEHWHDLVLCGHDDGLRTLIPPGPPDTVSVNPELALAYAADRRICMTCGAPAPISSWPTATGTFSPRSTGSGSR